MPSGFQHSLKKARRVSREGHYLKEIYLKKAEENLAAAHFCLEKGLCNASASRAYYACFHAAIAALLNEDVHPPSPPPWRWDHDWVQAQFHGELINRRHIYGRELRGILNENEELREQADYRDMAVSEKLGQRALSKARDFVGAVRTRVAPEKREERR